MACRFNFLQEEDCGCECTLLPSGEEAEVMPDQTDSSTSERQESEDLACGDNLACDLTCPEGTIMCWPCICQSVNTHAKHKLM